MSSKRKPNTKGKKGAKKKKSSVDKTYRFIALIGALVLVGGLLAVGAVVARTAIAQGPTPGFYVDGKRRAKDADPFLTIGEFEISYNEYRYYYLYTKAQTEAYQGAEYYDVDVDGSKEQQLFDDTEGYIRRTYVWLTYAQENGIILTEEEKQGILKEAADNKASQHEMYVAWLRSQYYADEATYILIREKTLLNQKAAEAFLEAEKKLHDDDWMDGVVSAQHILYQFPDGADDAAKEELRKEAQKALDDIRAAVNPVEAFTILRASSSSFNESYGMWVNYGNDGGQPEEGYTFGPGTMVDSFYDAAIALRVDGISDLVETTYGYHIIRRCELDIETAEADKDGIIERLANKMFNNYQADRAKEFIIIGSAYYYDARIATIK